MFCTIDVGVFACVTCACVLEAKTEQKVAEIITCDGNTPKSDDCHASLLDARQRLKSKLTADMKLINDDLTLRRSAISCPKSIPSGKPQWVVF